MKSARCADPTAAEAGGLGHRALWRSPGTRGEGFLLDAFLPRDKAHPLHRLLTAPETEAQSGRVAHPRSHSGQQPLELTESTSS